MFHTLCHIKFSKNQAHAHEIVSYFQDPIGVRIGHGSQVKLTARCKSSTFITALLSSIETKYHGHWALQRLSSNDLSYLHFYSSTSRVRSRAVESSFIYSIIFIILCRLSLISCYNCTFSLKLDSEGKKLLSSWWEMSGCWNVICHCPFLAALKVTSSVHLRSCVLGISLISAYILWVLARCMILLAKLVGWCWNITPPLCTVINIHSGHSAAPLLLLHRTNFGQVRLTSASTHYKIDIYVLAASLLILLIM